MFILTAILVALTLAYVCLMLVYSIGWHRQPYFVLPPSFVPHTFISVIIPARNERNNIGNCIEALLAQNYPRHLFEIVVVDDHSTDGTAGIVNSYSDDRLRCIALADHLPAQRNMVAYKKAALALGIAHSLGSLLVTTDADCTAQAGWLTQMAAIYERDMPAMIVAPVVFTSDNSVLQLFQLIDFMSMQGITAAAHRFKLGNMSNGANLAFSRDAFNEVGGYSGVDHFASGDDYLLMMKMNRVSPGSVSYLKSQDAIVSTAPQADWHGLLQQRVRWSSKSGKYNDTRLTAILMLVYLFNVALLSLAITCCWQPHLLAVLLAVLVVKVLAEYLLVVPVARFFGQQRVLKYFPLLQPLHIIYIVIAGFLGLVGGYSWKGRAVR